MNIADFFDRQSKPVLVVLGVVAILLIGVGDYFATKRLLEFSVFFVLPISFFTWFITQKAGLVVCVFSAAIILGVNLGSTTDLANLDVAYWNAAVWFGFFLLSVFIVSDLKALHQRERRLARIDSLTGAATRLAFYEFANDEVHRARRLKQPTTLAYLDIDCFKQINDRNGHGMGDKVLIAVARSMKAGVRRTDMVARMGGDEFALLLPNTHKDAAATLLKKVSSLLRASMKERRWPVTFSIGAVTFRNAPESVEQMLERADEMMYSVKQSGKNRIEQQEMSA
ncbi:MAG TPA: GGDEF domain-containing protein [Terriglobales bacterium]|nr:GGDEF domain-containing protein [Terriglobales bacterium]